MEGLRCGILGAALLGLVLASRASAAPMAPELQTLRAEGGFGRVDLIWEQSPSLRPAGQDSSEPENEALFFEIERRDPGAASFRRINKRLWTTNVYGDFIGRTSGSYAYRVRAILVSKDGRKNTFSAWSPVVEASPRKASTVDLITEVQEASFRYFYDWRHPVSGLAREKTPFRSHETIDRVHRGYVEKARSLRDLCTTGATGMGMFNLVVGVERGFITRDQGTAWALQMLRFLSTKADRFHGAFPHWLSGTTGKTIPFAGPTDNGADTVETAFLASGFIVLREYFTADTPAEREIRELADTLWRAIEWNWFTRDGGPGGPIYWHWSPDHGWDKGHPVCGFHEGAILYVLAAASPTHAVPPEAYHKAWRGQGYGIERTEFGVEMTLGRRLGPPLFFTHYSYLGLDPRAISYRGESYFDHFRKFCQVQIKYAESKADVFEGYGPLWGLTSSVNPKGYKAHCPGDMDDGTIAPTAGLSSIPYVPREGVELLKTLYLKYGRQLWKDYGFTDAFNPSEDWIAPTLLGIDAGPIAPMIENARTRLCWNTFMRAPEIQTVLPLLEEPSESLNPRP